MPDPRITDFISQFNGGARPNRFDVLMTFPSGVNNEMEKMSFTCKGASLPASNVNKVEVPYMSRQIAVSGDRTVDDWTVTVINDSDFRVRNAFEQWLNHLNQHEGNRARSGWNNPKAYYGSAIVTQFDREHKPSKIITMKDIFPTAMSDITLGWADNDTIEEFTITLAVNWWSTELTN